MAGGGQMGGGQPPSGAYGSPNFDSSQPSSGSGMSPFRQFRGMLGGMAGSGMAPVVPESPYSTTTAADMGAPTQPNFIDQAYRDIYNRPASADELSYYKNEFGDDISRDERMSLVERLKDSRGPETTQQQSMMNNPYFRPLQNYMYSPFMSMRQYNPYTRGYFGADPMYGGYSPFIPRMPTPPDMYTGGNRNRLADIDADMKAEEANQEGKRRRPLGHGAYEYY